MVQGCEPGYGLRRLAAYRGDGPAALAHGNRGRRPHNSVPGAAAAAVVRLVSNQYAGANHTHFNELLGSREGIDLSRPTMPITQSIPKATVFVGGGIVSVVDYQGASRWRKVEPLRSQAPTLGGGNPGTTRNMGPRSRSTRDTPLPSRLGGSINGKLRCSLDWALDGPRTDRLGCSMNSRHPNSYG